MIHNKFRYILTLVALFAMTAGAWADDKKVVLKADPITVANGSEAKIEVKMDYTTEKTLVGLSFSLYLPDGILLKGFDTKEAQDAAKASELKRAFDINVETGLWGNEEGASGWFSVKKQVDGSFLINIIDQDDKTPFVTTHAPVISINVHAVADVSNVNGTINGITLTDNENNSVEQGNIAEVTIPFNATAQEPDPNAVAISWDKTTKTGTFTQPGYDVELTPIYAPAAQWATESNEVLTPKVAEGIIAGTDAPLIVEGTVATGQGTVMYFATTEQLTAEQAAQANGWLSTLPTAEGYDDATTVYVWYYIQGADTPDGQEATAENTFNDSEICATPLEVSVLSNKFDITFNAANANTIEGQNGKGTVTVKTGDAEAVDKTADIDENHQLKAVKMGSTVTITTKEGYKFRKVEAKEKGAATPTPEGPTLAQTLTTANMTVKVYYTYTDMNNTCEFLSNGDGTYTFQSGTGLVGGNSQKAKALVVENGKLVFKQNFYETLSKLWNMVGFSVTFDTSENTYSIWKGSNETINATLSKVEVNGTQIALTQQ